MNDFDFRYFLLEETLDQHNENLWRIRDSACELKIDTTYIEIPKIDFFEFSNFGKKYLIFAQNIKF
mgnify:CR=1 FL=1